MTFVHVISWLSLPFFAGCCVVILVRLLRNEGPVWVRISLALFLFGGIVFTGVLAVLVISASGSR